MENKVPAGFKVIKIINENDISLYEEALSIADAAIDTGKNPEGEWVLTAFFEVDVSGEMIQRAFDLASSMLGQSAESVVLEPIYAEDWEAKMKYEFPPLQIGSFFIHTFDEEVPAGMVGLHIPAGMAFGTGEHPTTAGCLDVYEKVSQNRSFKKGLDMGCGSAILAMAVAKKDKVPFLAVDIDEPSIVVAQENVEFNGETAHVTCLCGDGFKTDEVVKNKPFDLIFANILAAPLIAMSAELTASLEKNGFAILSGYLEEQKEKVHAAYEDLGLECVAVTSNGTWVASAFKKK